MVEYLGDRNPPFGDLEGDVYIESDCEGDSPFLDNKSPETEEREDQNRAVFVMGSFSTYVLYAFYLFCLRLDGNDGFPRWKSLFFYRCTEDILFAPLVSQGVESRSNYVHQNTTTAAPPPCSPKGIYSLARSVRQPSIGIFRNAADTVD